jgi:hypothetical protein
VADTVAATVPSEAGLGMQADRHLAFDETVAGEGGDADGGANVAAGFAKDLDEEVGVAIDDFGWVDEARRCVDVAVDGDNLGYAVEGAKVVTEDGEMGERAASCGVVAGFDVSVGGCSAGQDPAVFGGDDAGEVDDLADGLGGDVVAAQHVGVGQGYAEDEELGFGCHSAKA